MSDPDVRRALFVCDGAVAPPEVVDQDWTISRAISTRGDDPAFVVVLEGLARKVMGEVHPRARDLIRIAACCFAADLQLPREGIDVHRVRWRREFHLWITVTDPAFWSDPCVTRRLTDTLAFATEDTWHLQFQHDGAGDQDIRIVFTEVPSPRRPDTVVLFSGGSDSLCALVDALRSDGREPVVVSHWPAGHIKGRQNALLHAVEERFQHWDIPHASFEIHRVGKGRVESSQRSRSFLYASLGAAIAAQYGITEVRLADNGYVSVNPPISDQLVGALASRGTHPKFLHLANQLLALVFPSGIHLINPLWNKTRAEAFGILVDAGCADLLALTYTCGQQHGLPKGKSHCGGCSQCVDRRMAVIAAGLEQHDPIERYDLDLFADPLPDGEPRTIAVSFVRFAERHASLTPEDILDDVPQLDECFIADDPEFRKKIAGIPAMLNRHAQETIRAVTVMRDRAHAANTLTALAPNALLTLWSPRDCGAKPEDAAARFGVAVVDYSSSLVHTAGTWILEFRGEKGYIGNLTGMGQLAHLLEHPTQRLDILALDDGRAVAVRKPLTLEDLRAGFNGSLGDIITAGGEEVLTTYLAEIPNWIEVAKAKGRRAEIGELKAQAALIQRELRTARNIRGERRTSGDPKEQARKNVSKNVQKCYLRLRGQVPAFVKHAKQCVHIKIPAFYEPDPPETWTVER